MNPAVKRYGTHILGCAVVAALAFGILRLWIRDGDREVRLRELEAQQELRDKLKKIEEDYQKKGL